MAVLVKMKNGRAKVANKKRRAKRRNTATVAKVANRKRRRRNSVSSASVKSYASRNGMKLVSNRKRRRRNGVKLVANKKRRGRRRNGVISRANGLFSGAKRAFNKNTATVVISLLAGLGITKIESALLSPIAAQFLAYVGLQNYAKPIVEAGLAVTVNRMAADAIKRGSGEYVMYGGLTIAAMDLLMLFIPSASAYNPFSVGNQLPLILNQPSLVSPAAVAALNAATGGRGAKTGAILRPRAGNGYARPRV